MALEAEPPPRPNPFLRFRWPRSPGKSSQWSATRWGYPGWGYKGPLQWPFLLVVVNTEQVLFCS